VPVSIPPGDRAIPRDPDIVSRRRAARHIERCCRMNRLNVHPKRLPRLMLALALILAAGAASASGPRVFAGPPVAVGDGVARVVVATNGTGVPASVSVVLTAGALTGLPPAGAGHEAWEYVLPMPAEAPATGYRHVGLDWNPVGHIPEGVYSVPHFDVHFYLIDNDERQAITFLSDARERAIVPPDTRLVPAGFVVPPDTAVERMGLHGFDPAGAEFHGSPFTHTFLYGYHAGRLVFVEPMVSLTYLQTRADVTIPIRTPAAVTFAGYYPGRYRVGYDTERDEYRVALLDLHAMSPESGTGR
jgi:hypothetical protein